MDIPTYVSNKITKHQTANGLIEFSDRMNPASRENYAHIHATKENDESGSRIYSRIGVEIQDYSKGTGDNCVRVTANLSPEEMKYLYQISVLALDPKYRKDFIFNYPEWSGEDKSPFQTKIFGNPNNEGRSPVTKFRIARELIDSKGTPYKSPWFVAIHNGTGVKKGTKNGGSYLQGGTFKLNEKGSACIRLTDLEFFTQMCRVQSFISAWEVAHGSLLIKQAVKAKEEYRQYQKHQNAA